MGVTRWVRRNASEKPALRIDVTVKPLFGHQECAEIGYSPAKPGRPSHTYHSYLMAGLRLVLDVNVEAGNKRQANTTLPGLVELLDRMPADKRPRCVRGDCGFGQDATMRALEDRQIPYLFKLKLTKNVKRYLEQVFWSEPVGLGRLHDARHQALSPDRRRGGIDL